MAFADNLPINESLGVFVGVAGMDWLVDGHAELMRALLVAIAAGSVIFVVRHWRNKHRKN